MKNNILLKEIEVYVMRKVIIFFAVFVLAALFAACKARPVLWRPGKPLPKEKIKIGVIHPNQINPDSSYDYMHHLGILQMQKILKLTENQIILKINVFEEQPGVVENAMRDCIADGANIILALSWGYGAVCEKLAEEFPGVLFAHATGNKHNGTNFTNYGGRIYQARYLSGVVAGLRTRTGGIGYVAAMGKDNSEVTSGINAFALGVERVNPAARIRVKVIYSWFDPMGETDAARSLIDEGCDVIAMHCNTPHPVIAAEKAGAWAIGYNSDMSDDAPGAVMTSVVFDWGVYYIRFLRSVIDGTFTAAPYFGGLDEGIIGLTPLNEKLVPPGTADLVEAERRRIIEGDFSVFDGVMGTNDGETAGIRGKTMSDSEITGGMNWYYRTIIEEP
jgi:basic membrane protein A